ncbi:MAG: hypothetical protein ACYDBH_24175, partial [Acidobacteriaceae bacterium]
MELFLGCRQCAEHILPRRTEDQFHTHIPLDALCDHRESYTKNARAEFLKKARHARFIASFILSRAWPGGAAQS